MDWGLELGFFIEMSRLAINWFAAWNLNFEGWPYVRGGLHEGFHCMKKKVMVVTRL